MTAGKGKGPWEYMRDRRRKLPDWRPECFVSPLAASSREVLPAMLEPRIAPVVLHIITRVLTETDIGALRAIPVFSCGGHDVPTYRTIPDLDAWIAGRPWVLWKLYPSAEDRQQIGRLVQNLLALVRRIDVCAKVPLYIPVADTIPGYYAGSHVVTAFDRSELQELLDDQMSAAAILRRFEVAYRC